MGDVNQEFSFYIFLHGDTQVGVHRESLLGCFVDPPPVGSCDLP